MSNIRDIATDYLMVVIQVNKSFQPYTRLFIGFERGSKADMKMIFCVTILSMVWLILLS
jgi:hypothetical protein